MYNGEICTTLTNGSDLLITLSFIFAVVPFYYFICLAKSLKNYLLGEKQRNQVKLNDLVRTSILLLFGITCDFIYLISRGTYVLVPTYKHLESLAITLPM